jgi:acyl-CoA synthetase (NDP forming)
MASHDPFPISTARSYAAGASVALSEADAFWTHDEPRTDRCLTEALAALDAARASVLETIAQRTPVQARRVGKSAQRPTTAAHKNAVGMVMAGTVSAALVALPLAALIFGRF